MFQLILTTHKLKTVEKKQKQQQIRILGIDKAVTKCNTIVFIVIAPRTDAAIVIIVLLFSAVIAVQTSLRCVVYIDRPSILLYPGQKMDGCKHETKFGETLTLPENVLPPIR